MALDLYYSNFSNVGKNLEALYAQFLVETELFNDTQKSCEQPKKEAALLSLETSPPTTELQSLKSLLGRNAGRSGGAAPQTRINSEYVGRPLKASERLKFVQQQRQQNELNNEQQQQLPNVDEEKALEAQKKLFEQCVQDKKAENLGETVEENTLAEENEQELEEVEAKVTDETEACVAAAAVTEEDKQVTPKNKITKERRADQPHFLARPYSARHRLKQPAVEILDWHAEVELNGIRSPEESPQSLKLSHSPQSIHNGQSNPVSPNEIKRNNYRNHSFRSNKSDQSTRSTHSVDRNFGNPRFDFKIFDNNRRANNSNYQHQRNNSTNNSYNTNSWGRGNRNYDQNQFRRTYNNNNNNYYDDGNNQKQNNSNYKNNSLDDNSGVQKRFNVHNNNRNNSNYNSGGGGSGGGNNYNSHTRRYQSKKENNYTNARKFHRSGSAMDGEQQYQNDDDDDRHSIATVDSAKYSQAFLKYLEH